MDILLLVALVLALVAAPSIVATYMRLWMVVDQDRCTHRDDMPFLASPLWSRQFYDKTGSYLERLMRWYAVLALAWIVVAYSVGPTHIFDVGSQSPAQLFTVSVLTIATGVIVWARLELHLALHPKLPTSELDA